MALFEQLAVIFGQFLLELSVCDVQLESDVDSIVHPFVYAFHFGRIEEKSYWKC